MKAAEDSERLRPSFPPAQATIVAPGADNFICPSILARSGVLGVPPQRIIINEGWLDARDYVQALAAHLGSSFVDRPDDAAPGCLLVNATDGTPAEVAREVADARALGREPVLFTGALDRNVEANEPIADAAVKAAVGDLRRDRPEVSAGRRMWVWQYFVCAFTFGSLAGLLISEPAAASLLLLVLSAYLFAGIAGCRLLLFAGSLMKPAYVRPRQRLDDQALPTYCVLVPLFREAAVLPDLVDALARLDYPPAKLDIVLILEAADSETRTKAGRIALPPYIRIVVVPDREPRTKPKALNFGLALSRGDLVAVYDAEDIPAPDQLRKVAAAFAAHPGRFICLQARLAPYNTRQSWLTRHFAIEYATLFHATLPALRRLGLPIPLSGTSNHFSRTDLEASHWDPFNVTEDADLGVRLNRQGGEIGLVDSETLEEAPHRITQWLPQRTRWIKGWMQTYLAHTREPIRLARELGPWRLFGFHALFGGFLLSVLAYPWLIALLLLEFHQPQPFATVPGSLHHVALVVALVDLIAGIVASLLMTWIGVRRARLSRLAADILAAPVYWLLISLAGYRALIQFIWRPHLWEKTEHSARRRHKTS